MCHNRLVKDYAHIVRAAALVLLAGLIAGGTAWAGSDSRTLTLQTGQSSVLRYAQLRRVAIGDKAVASVVPIGTSQLLIDGKVPGRTTLFIWTGDAGHEFQHVIDLTVTSTGVDTVAQMLRSTIDSPQVLVQDFGHTIVVRGTVSDGAHFQAISDILGRFGEVAKSDKYTIVNAVLVAHPLGDLQSQVVGLPGASDIRVDPDGKGSVIVSGRVRDEATRQEVLDRVRSLAGRYLSSNGQLIDRLGTQLETQVDVRVNVLEIDKTGLSQLGVKLNAGNLDEQGQLILGPPSFPIVEQNKYPLNPFRAGPFFRTTVLAPQIDLLVQEGHARVLSSPNLVTMPGNEANFLVGGEIPVPISTGIGQVSVSYKEFGVKLDITPVVLGNGNVQTKIAPEVSDLDFQDGVSINGFVIPALRESKLATELVTMPGESIIMGGLLRHQEQRNVDEIPLLGRLPIIGRLFRDVRYQRNETDVVFVMTPYVITR
ncbi:MAG: pilus assembly protein N-terminal domain-containing protein [Candidatus Eremiobacteraeota bacterium]|nr:pilus assembly protein N-terminal domain-containing protein [Candidatus Eremiobacteraeota bacterium]